MEAEKEEQMQARPGAAFSEVSVLVYECQKRPSKCQKRPSKCQKRPTNATFSEVSVLV
jgi:hypothetical protein